MDAIYFFRHSEHHDSELRYSLRSVARYMPWIRKVWIFGCLPSFIADDTKIIEHVPHEYMAAIGDYRTPMTNFFLMFYTSSLIPGLSSEYCWFCDDFICLADIDPATIRLGRYVEDLADVSNPGGGIWRDSLKRTGELLSRLGYPSYNFETHAPTYFTKKRVLEAWCDLQDFVTEDRWFGLVGPTAILNHALQRERFELIRRDTEAAWVGIHGHEPNQKEVLQKTAGKSFLNFDDTAYGPAIQHFLSERLPDKCRYER